MKKQTIATLKKSLMACGAAILLVGPLSAQLYTDGGTVGSNTTSGNNYVGIGTSAPGRQLDIQNRNNATANTWFQVTNVDNNGTTSSPGFLMRKARGTVTAGVPSPAAVQVGDRVGFFLAAGYAGSTYYNCAGITFKIDNAPAAPDMRASIDFEAGYPRVTQVQIQSDGDVWIKDLSTAVGDYVMIDTDGTLTTGTPSGGGGGSNWDSPSTLGAGEGHIWFTAGTAAADTIAVDVEFSLEQSNSIGINSWYSGGTSAIADPIAVAGSSWAGSGYGIGVAGSGGWYGVVGVSDASGWGVYSIGDAGVQGDLTVTGTVTSSSDARLKQNVNTLDGALANIMKLQPRSYEYRTNEFPDMNLAEGLNFGFVAQELQQVFPNLVKQNTIYTKRTRDSKFDFLSVNYTGLIPVMVGAIQEQQAAISNLNERLNNVEELLKKKTN